MAQLTTLLLLCPVIALGHLAQAADADATCEAEQCETDTFGALQTPKAFADSKAFAKVSTGFLTDEHKAAGDAIKLTNGFKGSQETPLPDGKGFNLTYGDALSLCADFYGYGHIAISDGKTDADQEKSFKDSPWKCITSDPDDPKRIHAFAASDVESAAKTLDMPLRNNGCSSYLPLAAGTQSVDHFSKFAKYSFADQGGAGNWEAYSAGHRVACDAAAANKGNQNKLNEALLMNGCASHYLSDHFAAGHLRIARRAIPTLMCKVQHDEDNMYGLNVTNKRGDSWRVYGDGFYFSEWNKKAVGIQNEALTASAEGVLQAWKSGNASTCKADTDTASIVPDLQQVQDPYTAEKLGNAAPLTLPTTGHCGLFSSGKCIALGNGTIVDTYNRKDACNMKDYAVDKYGYYESASTLTKLEVMCPQGSRGQKSGFLPAPKGP